MVDHNGVSSEHWNKLPRCTVGQVITVRSDPPDVDPRFRLAGRTVTILEYMPDDDGQPTYKVQLPNGKFGILPHYAFERKPSYYAEWQKLLATRRFICSCGKLNTLSEATWLTHKAAYPDHTLALG